MRLTRIAIAILAAATACGAASAQQVGNAGRGLDLSVKFCGSCHNVAPFGQTSRSPKAPTFQAISDARGMTQMALSAWLHSAHPTMPMVQLKVQSLEDITAYIRSLRQVGPETKG